MEEQPLAVAALQPMQMFAIDFLGPFTAGAPLRIASPFAPPGFQSVAFRLHQPLIAWPKKRDRHREMAQLDCTRS
jgi:hypothetical protein